MQAKFGKKKGKGLKRKSEVGGDKVDGWVLNNQARKERREKQQLRETHVRDVMGK